MPSPFPGMDPYLEAPDIWPDFHDAFASEIRGALNRTLPQPYYARLEMRPEIGIVEDAGANRRIVPDVSVVRQPGAVDDSGNVAVLDAPRTSVSKSFEVQVANEPIRHSFVEIRDPNRGHHLITLIEIASPSNKQQGPDRQLYLRKQREVLESDANLIELDLLRGGERLIVFPEVEQAVNRNEPVPHYLVLVNRGWQRAEGALAVQVFPILLTEPLPCILIPLRQGQDEVPLDLQFLFSTAYDNGPYRRGAVDYTRPPIPPLPEELAGWGEECLKTAKLA